MKIGDQIKGLAHVGIPTNDIEKTVEFYRALGFKVVMRTYNEEAGEKVAFLNIGDYCIETFENGSAALEDGAYQHVALDVKDVEQIYSSVKEAGYVLLTDGIMFLPFWERGVRFFMIQGPNRERIEFCQKL